jgi:hypothetical protein
LVCDYTDLVCDYTDLVCDYTKPVDHLKIYFSEQMNTCEYCDVSFTTNQSLKRHYGRCKEKEKRNLIVHYHSQIEKYEKQLQEQRDHYEKQLQEQRDQYEKQLQEQRDQHEKETRLIKEQLSEFKNQIFEIAKQPKTNVTNHTTQTTQTHNNRNTNIINQLAIYDLTQDQITQLLAQHYNLDTFHGGPEEIAKLAARLLLTDPQTQKPKVACTDISRKNFKYVDEEQEVQVDPGFQKTHDLIKEPLSKANIRVYVEDLNNDDRYRDQWRKNEDFISDRTGFSDKMIKWMV